MPAFDVIKALKEKKSAAVPHTLGNAKQDLCNANEDHNDIEEEAFLLDTYENARLLAKVLSPESVKWEQSTFSLDFQRRLPQLQTIYIAENAISEQQAIQLLQNIYFSKEQQLMKYLKHSKRNVLCFSQRETFPKWLLDFATGLHASLKSVHEKILPLEFNHVLINEYNSHTGILAHADGPLYQDSVVNISIGSPVLFRFKNSTTKEESHVILRDKSLILFTGDVYSKFTHEIAYSFDADVPLVERNGRRISITMRYCPPSNAEEERAVGE
jgi:2OG-Fe(II) oxygenase superfamily